MKSFYCSAVDTGLFVSVNGHVGVCCSGHGNFGSVRQLPINEIFKQPIFLKLQEDLKSNQPNSYCNGCYHKEKIAKNSSQFFAFNSQFPSIKNQRQLKLIDIRWSNVCNITCRYCNTNDSSEWRRLRNLPIESVNRDYTESLFQLIEENIDTIECVYLLGGEPLLQKHNVRLLDILPHHVKIDILTNGSVDLTKNKVYEKLKKFSNTYWSLSFDNVNNRFEYVRAGADWSLLNQNIDTLKQDFSANNVRFHPVYHIWNATRLREFYDFADSKGNLIVNWQLGLDITDQHSDKTDSFLVFGHNKSIIDLAIRELDSLNFDNFFLTGVKQSLLDDIEDTTKGARFMAWTKRSEQTVAPKYTFGELWPELNNILSK